MTIYENYQNVITFIKHFACQTIHIKHPVNLPHLPSGKPAMSINNARGLQPTAIRLIWATQATHKMSSSFSAILMLLPLKKEKGRCVRYSRPHSDIRRSLGPDGWYTRFYALLLCVRYCLCSGLGRKIRAIDPFALSIMWEKCTHCPDDDDYNGDRRVARPGQHVLAPPIKA